MTNLNAIPKETKDWSFVADQGCSECGYSPHFGPETGGRLRHTATAWKELLSHPPASQRPVPQVWSPLEYAAHVRDMCRLACERVGLMLAESVPTFSNWDQDEQAEINDYLNSDRLALSADLESQLELAARVFDQVPDNSWDRAGLRGDGKEFTVQSFSSFVLHEVEHHLQDAKEGLRKVV
ncbi:MULTISPECIES: DinB family protein [Arthrobacter]|uniref:DinB family protein n=1 Tax=Arthrobacter TaxID=1663 RepID=UPI0009E7B340|nr:DinB family protein [Arthrobacter sp. Edens01]